MSSFFRPPELEIDKTYLVSDEGLMKDILCLTKLEENLFRANNHDIGLSHIFGGQVLAQALLAAHKTVDQERMPHSLHAYFLRPGRLELPVEYSVMTLRDGKGFSTRQVTALQEHKIIFNLTASFQVPEEGLEHQINFPHHLPKPEELDLDYACFNQTSSNKNAYPNPSIFKNLPASIRPTTPLNINKPVKQKAEKGLWIKINESIPNDPIYHYCSAAYISDFGFLGTAMLPHGINYAQQQIQAASIDHALWFYNTPTADQWILHHMESDVASSGRGHNRGQLFQQDGTLFAVSCQDGLMRLI